MREQVIAHTNNNKCDKEARGHEKSEQYNNNNNNDVLGECGGICRVVSDLCRSRCSPWHEPDHRSQPSVSVAGGIAIGHIVNL